MVSAAGALAQHRQLAFIDPHRAIFAGMIDADHGFGIRRGAGRFGLGLRGIRALRLIARRLRQAERAQRRDQEGADRIIGRQRDAEQATRSTTSHCTSGGGTLLPST